MLAMERHFEFLFPSKREKKFMNLNPYAIPPLLCAIITLTAGIIIYWRNKEAELSKNFLAVCIATFTWLSFYAINLIMGAQNPVLGEVFLRIGYCGVAFISLTFFEFIATFVNLPPRKIFRIINLLYGLILVILIANTNLIVSGLYKFFWGYYPKAGSLHPFFLIIFLLHCSLGDYLLIRAFRKEPPNTHRYHQLKYLILGFTIFIIACLDFLGNYGIEFYPFGYIPATAFILIFFYTVLKHHLMDINIVINKGLVYSILITTISIIYLLTVLLIERLSQNIFRYNSLIVSILLAFLIAIFFVPLRDWVQKFVDRLFFRKTSAEIAEENALLRREIIKTEKLKAVATLASGMAHEIKNPLTAIKVFSEYLPQRLDDKEFLMKFSRIVGGEVNRIDGLVNELLEFAKPAPLQLKKININKLISDTLDFLNSRFIQHQIRVDTTLSPDCNTPVNIDPNKIKQALLNIFLNAIEAMPAGGVLTVAASSGSGLGVRGSQEAPSSFTSDERRTTNHVTLRVTDTGCGISKETLSHIFDPFFSTKDSGTGLGLPITHGIIADHGGTIAVQSEVGKGTTFVLTFPMEKLTSNDER